MQCLNSIPGTSSFRLLALAGLLAAVAGCGSLHGLRTEPVAAQGGASSTPASVPADAAITQSVRTQLALDLPMAEIEVRTAQGKVELRGTVEDADTARRAVKSALAIDGVRGVVNDLGVSPDDAGSGPALSASAL